MASLTGTYNVRREAGFTYLGLLFAVALAGVALAAAGVVWSIERQRENEKELLAIGREFRNAIASYYENAPGNVKRYPGTLEDLLKDNRFLGIKRHLRQIYVDPMTGARSWGFVTAPEGGIMGIHSLSGATPMKQGNFEEWCWQCAGMGRYADWRFVYRPENRGST